MRRGRLLFLFVSVLTGCAGLIGVPDLTFDENAEAGSNNPDGQASSSSGDVITSGDGPNGDTSTPTCNADLKTDKANCGACGHDCTNGLCADGICTLLENTYGAEAIAVQGDTVYLGFLGDSNPAGIVSCPTNGCASATVAAKPLLPPAQSVTIERIAVNATHLYASNYYDPGNPLRIALSSTDGGSFPFPHTAGTRSYGLALDSTTLYWTENESTGGVYQCPIPDCTGGFKKIADASNPELVVVAADGAVIFSDDNGYTIKKCASKANCPAPVTVPNHPGAYVNDFKIDNNILYWAGRYEVLSCALSPLCANPTTIVPEVTNDVITAIAVSGPTVYWSVVTYSNDAGSFLNDEGVIKTCQIANCGPTTKVIATKQKAPSQMALDAKSLYWTNNAHRGFVDGKGSVAKAPR